MEEKHLRKVHCHTKQWASDSHHSWTHIATGHHDSIGRFKDGVVVFHAFLIFDLADDLNALIVRAQHLTDLVHVTGLSDKGRRNKVDTVGDSAKTKGPQGDGQIREILEESFQPQMETTLSVTITNTQSKTNLRTPN